MPISAAVKALGKTALREAASRASEMRFAVTRHRAGEAQRTWGLPGQKVIALDFNPALSLPEARSASAQLARGVLERAGVDFFLCPSPSHRATILGVTQENAAAALSALAAAPELDGWRACAAGDALGNPVITPLGASRLRAVGGVRLWRVQAATATSRFRSGPTEGVEVLFFGANEDRPHVLEPLVRREGLAGLTLEQTQDRDAHGVPQVWARGRDVQEVGFPIDVVYTWVDGADAEWAKSKAQAKAAVEGVVFTERSDDESRFADHDELRYSLRSLEQFAPWVRHVWIVAAGQRPAWLRDSDRVTVVDHREIWPDPAQLPNFNSHAIEANLHRIQGLAEHFLYLNDDNFFGRPVSPEQFFRGSGLANAFLSRATVDFAEPVEGEIASTTAAKKARGLVLEQCGAYPTRKYFHAPAALTRSRQEELERIFPAEFAATRAAQFRTTEDIAAAGSLSMAYGLATGSVVTGRIRYDYIDPAVPDGAARMRRYLKARNMDTFCINDGSTEESPEERSATHDRIAGWLEEFLPVRSSFEREEDTVTSA
ncbi:stealth family protein [Galactobacter caseinivorans]|uniref:Sugar phosphotransferase n=1 Tax=Galactobacter caseinivorans TaxID=2676123 RepID=A0A496PN15_9MICC|nr:stealth family protein [Galactobacter caseinivorans]RKW71925.1 hypothetical protein DWQ67_03610 [Galactobacter caseinivorans]